MARDLSASDRMVLALLRRGHAVEMMEGGFRSIIDQRVIRIDGRGMDEASARAAHDLGAFGRSTFNVANDDGQVRFG